MRLGEILVGAGVLDERSLETALGHQAKGKARLGTSLLHLGFSKADQVSAALARQFDVPPALVRHFVNHDPKVLALIPKEWAHKYQILPIAYAKAGTRRLVLCMRDPRQSKLVAELSKRLEIPVVPCVAAELAIATYLNHFYGLPISDEIRHARSHGTATSSALDEDDLDIDLSEFEDESGAMSELQLVDLDHHEVERGETGYFDTRQQSAGSALLRATAELEAPEPEPEPEQNPEPVSAADAADQSAEGAEGGHSRQRGLGAPGQPGPGESNQPDLPLSHFAELIDAATEREAVIDALMAFMRQRFDAGLMLTIKEELALGHRGFGGRGSDDLVESIMVPMKDDNVLALSYQDKKMWNGDPSVQESPAQDRFFKFFCVEGPPVEVAIAPIKVGSRVISLLFAQNAKKQPLDPVSVQELEDLAESTGEAFGRIIRAKKKS